MHPSSPSSKSGELRPNTSVCKHQGRRLCAAPDRLPTTTDNNTSSTMMLRASAVLACLAAANAQANVRPSFHRRRAPTLTHPFVAPAPTLGLSEQNQGRPPPPRATSESAHRAHLASCAGRRHGDVPRLPDADVPHALPADELPGRAVRHAARQLLRHDVREPRPGRRGAAAPAHRAERLHDLGKIVMLSRFVALPVSLTPKVSLFQFDGCNTCHRETADGPMACTLMMCFADAASECRGWALGYGPDNSKGGH